MMGIIMTFAFVVLVVLGALAVGMFGIWSLRHGDQIDDALDETITRLAGSRADEFWQRELRRQERIDAILRRMAERAGIEHIPSPELERARRRAQRR